MEDNTVRQDKPKKRKKTAWKIMLIVLGCLFLFCAVIVLAGSLYLDHIFGLFRRVDGSAGPMNDSDLMQFMEEDKEVRQPDCTMEVVEPEDIPMETVGEEIAGQDGVINILLIGHDARPGETRARSDAMILFSLNTVKKEFTTVSFLRDMYVTIPDYCGYKLNAAYAWGDMELLNRTLQTNFGIEIHGDFSVNFVSFRKVIDKIGGVEVELTGREAGYLGLYGQGSHCLNGSQALAYARLRSIGDGDFDRTARQRKVISGIINKCSQLSALELNELLEEILPLVETNMDKTQIKEYALEFLSILAVSEGTNSLQIPMDGTYRYAWVSDMSVLMTDISQNREGLKKVIYGE